MARLPRILVAGIGNIFFGDDAFGVEAARALLREPVPDGVAVRDFGIRSYDLAGAMVEGYDAVIFVDATPRGDPPGTLCVLELDPPGPATESEAAVNGHSLHPASVLRLAAAFGDPPKQLYLVGCEPEVLETEEGAMGLSESVAAALPGAVARVRSLLAQLLSSNPLNATLRPHNPGEPLAAAATKGN